MKQRLIATVFFVASAVVSIGSGSPVAGQVQLSAGSRVVLLGNGHGSRMLHVGSFETELQLRHPELRLFVRNMCDEGNTPSFRPHSGRANQLGFPGAEAFFGPHADGNEKPGVGHRETEEEWLVRLAPDVLIAFFGFNESFQGLAGIDNFRAELDAFVAHTQQQKYNGESAPQIVLVSPTAFEDRSASMGVSDGRLENANLAAYTAVMEGVAGARDVAFVNAFNPSMQWYAESRRPLTSDGALLNEAGYQRFSQLLVDEIFGAGVDASEVRRERVAEAVREKNWFWINDFKIPNGVHVFGRRYDPFGPANYPFEIEKIRAMTAIRDENIWAALRGESFDLAARDAQTLELPAVETNYKPRGEDGEVTFLEGEEALATIEVPAGYRIEQWATEVEFPDLANPVQLSFDNQGRLWVATMPSYPHYRPGDPRPDDKLLILEDTDGDGKADKQTVFADGLHLPMGFEISHEGVFVSQGIHLMLLRDRDGDDHVDEREIIFSGFDDHDTHHAIGAYCADPSGALLMCEGVFLRTNVETAHGPVRGTDGGFYRFAPQRRQLERHAQLSIPNPWGIAFDDWGQHFFLHTSGSKTEWMLPGSIKPRYGVATPGSRDLIEPAHRVRPTSGIEFLHSRHFPDEVQGDMLLNNTIGFLGTKQHRVVEAGTGFETTWRQDLTKSSDPNYRPVDLEVAPDGSLYLVDWHNPLIGHMQHNARDPFRDHDHGRIYRVTYPSRPLVEPANIAGASLPELLANLELPEYRTRYRTRRELRGRRPEDVLEALDAWVADLDTDDARYEHHLLEALWVTWGLDRVDEGLLQRVMGSSDHRARAAAARVLRYSGHRVANQAELLAEAARDEHGRVKLEAIAAGSWLEREAGLAVLAAARAGEAPAADEQAKYVSSHDGGRRFELAHPSLASRAVDAFRITLPGKQRILNLAELRVFRQGEDVTASADFSQSSEFNGGQYPIGNLVDGKQDTFAHTATQDDPWIEARFATAGTIDRMEIWNRVGYEDRFEGAIVEFRAGAETLARLEVELYAGGGLLADSWLRAPYRTAEAHLKNQTIEVRAEVEVPEQLAEAFHGSYLRGAEIYAREGHCATCHQPDGLGLQAGGFPPLAGTAWATGDEERLIKLSLNGLLGPMEVLGKPYPGLVPMTPFADLLDDEELADVLTYVRSSFGNEAAPVTPQRVREVRVATQSKVGFYSPDELEGGAATTGLSFVKLWERSDFEADLEPPLRGRDYANGAAMFAAASCSSCHNVQGRGGSVGADLTGVGERYSALELLDQILDPSAVIRDEHRLFTVELDDDSFYQGLIVSADSDRIVLAEALQRLDDTVAIEREEITRMTPLDISPMPTGLLVTLTHTEVLDLLAFVQANGDKQHAAFSK